MDRPTLLESLDGARERLRAALEDLDPAAVDPGSDAGWTVKDTVAHLVFWQEYAAAACRALLAGGEPDPEPLEAELDGLNARARAAWASRSPAEVVAADSATRDALREIAATASEADLFERGRFAWDGGTPLADWVAGTAVEHLDEHLPALDRVRAATASSTAQAGATSAPA